MAVGKVTDESDGVPELMPRVLLKTLLSSSAKSDEKEAIVTRMQQLRGSNQEALSQLLDGMLAEVEGLSAVWKGLRWPFPPPSYRAKLGILSRILDSVLDGETEPRRKRSAMSQLVRQLPTAGGVWALQKEAVRRNKRAVSMEEMLERTPKDLETPKYTVLAQKSGWEVRNYDQFSVVSTLMDSSFGPGSFNALAGYIFGGNKEGVKMAMTTPVINQGGSKMSFVMPPQYWDPQETTPTPATNDIKIEGEGGGLISDSTKLAVMWFGGFASKDEVTKRKAALIAAIKADDAWEAVDDSKDPFLLQYNDPFQPPWKRRNEVVVPVKERAPVAAKSAAAA
eukprot:CAMPEP_0206211714 /NCGR_PEP_ID=MMETSP0047_2-20121206/146_1 /ASSEMBLY_ACC=CAM_ASM_000192 /TAXON_ID=195065 /ORGANISM="Chroomonas mesostigmatica_cf, Strain CCMP1168" /LENGTH=337 /DNA_ID=CAMNT_0053633635 /DNA_START=110 /DNA_END=1123 /DNA_ORIENTATION=+